LNVLLVHSGKWEYPTGIIAHIRNLARALADRDHSVKVIMLGNNKEFVEGGGEYLFSPNLLHFILDVHRQAKQSDVIHCHDTLSVLSSLPKRNHALIYTNHSVFADTRFHCSHHEWQGNTGLSLRTKLKCSVAKILGRNVLRTVDKVIAVSNFVKDTVNQIYGVSSSKIEVVFNGVDAKDFTCSGITSNKEDVRRIFFVKPNEPRKGLHHLLKALPLILWKIPEVKLIVVGIKPSGDYQQFIQGLIERSHIRDNVIFTGKIDFSDLVYSYLSSDLVIIPSIYEAFAIVALEAGICSKPVIASNIGGLNEAVVDGETGFLVDVRNPTLLAEAITKILSDNSLARRLGENARKRILENFTWDRISTKVECIYKAALAESSTIAGA